MPSRVQLFEGSYEFLLLGLITSGIGRGVICGEVILDAPDRTLELTNTGEGVPSYNVDQD